MSEFDILKQQYRDECEGEKQARKNRDDKLELLKILIEEKRKKRIEEEREAAEIDDLIAELDEHHIKPDDDAQKPPSQIPLVFKNVVNDIKLIKNK